MQLTTQDVSDEILKRFHGVGTATVYSSLSRRGYENCVMDGVMSFSPGAKLVARARTVRYLPDRLDLIAELRGGTPEHFERNNPDAPEYRAMGACGLGDVLVCDAMGKHRAANIGDVKLFYLKQRKAEGIVTDGAIRDLNAVLEYGLTVFAGGRTPLAARFVMTEYQDNVDIQCGGVLVRPGDVIVGDDDGVVVVPKQLALEVVEWAEEHEAAEDYIMELVAEEGVPSGKYYPPSDEFKERMRRTRG